MRRLHWFQLVSHGVLALFLGIILYVISIAYTRRSGFTGLDMATIQKIRYDHQNSLSPPP